MQKLLMVITTRCDVRERIEGWTYEDSDQVEAAFVQRLDTKNITNINDMPIGMVSSLSTEPVCYRSILHAMADGWKLLAPPVETTSEDITVFEWWLVKE